MAKKAAAVFALILSAVFMVSCAGYENLIPIVSAPVKTGIIDVGNTPEISAAPSAAVSASCTQGISVIPTEIVSISSMSASQIQIQRIIIKSSFLYKNMNVNVYLPPNYDTAKKYPVLYFFHGYRGNENDWEKNMNLVSSAYDLFSSGLIKPFIIVTPDIENSYGINSSLTLEPVTAGISTGFKPDYGPYEDYIIKELIPCIDSNYSTVTDREGRYIGGLSMGGFAALHLCFAHTELFSKAGGHSPALWIYTSDPKKVTDVITWLYPSVKLRQERDPLMQAESTDFSGIKVWLDCGTKDRYGFYQGTKELYDILISREAQAEYHAFTGGHSNEYWKTHIIEYLTFYGS